MQSRKSEVGSHIGWRYLTVIPRGDLSHLLEYSKSRYLQLHASAPHHAPIYLPLTRSAQLVNTEVISFTDVTAHSDPLAEFDTGIELFFVRVAR